MDEIHGKKRSCRRPTHRTIRDDHYIRKERFGRRGDAGITNFLERVQRKKKRFS
jgi:hypothetical protein